MTLLSKAEILAADDRPTKEINVPEWGGTVRVRALGCAEQDVLDKITLGNAVDNFLARATVLQLCLVDENNRLMFTAEEVAALAEKSPRAADRLIKVAQELSYPESTGEKIEVVEKN